MEQTLSKNVFLVKEHVGIFKAANNYDIHDPETGDVTMQCREENLGPITKLLRFTDYKRYTPFEISVQLPDGRPIVRVTRGIAFIRSRVTVHDHDGQPIGMFKQKIFSLGGAFDVLDMQERVVCSLKGKWTGWDFRFMAGDIEFARVTKKWTGLGRELFTSADNYVLAINEEADPDIVLRQLILAAVMCIDMVLKE